MLSGGQPATVVYFANGDVKQTVGDGRIRYYFNATLTTQVTLPPGPAGGELFHFGQNGQMERHTAAGAKFIRFPDGNVSCVPAA